MAGFDKRKLMAQLERERRAAVRVKLRELRQKIKEARARRREAIANVKAQCRAARKKLREVCCQRRKRARDEGETAIQAARRELERERVEAEHLGAAIRRSEGKSAKRSSSAERRQESDDAVRSNIPRELAKVFERVKKHIHGSRYRSRTEAFLEWAHDNPGEVYAIQAEDAERDLARLIAEHERTERAARRRSLSAEVPF